MRQILLFAITIFLTVTATAQNTWKVSLNGKTLVQATDESEEKNNIRITSADLSKKGSFVITYKGSVQKNWSRSIMALDTMGMELKKQTGNTFKISNVTLSTLFKKSKTIKIYTWALPNDPAMQAVVRVRRVHLCTLVLQ